MKIAFNQRTALIGGALLLLYIIFGSGRSGEDNALRIGVSADYSPFEFHKNGELVGIDIDIANKIAKNLDRKIQWQQLSFDNLIGALESNRIDLIISGMSETAERAKRVDFTDMYYENSFSVVYRSTSPIKTLQDMHGKKIGVQTASTMETLLRKVALTHEIKEFSLNNNNILIEELKLGRIDGVLIETMQAYEYTKNNKALQSAELYAVNDGQGYTIALAKGSKLKTDINNILHKLKSNGELDAIIKRWEPEMQAKEAEIDSTLAATEE